METHRIHPELLERQVRVLVVGCGGTGRFSLEIQEFFLSRRVWETSFFLKVRKRREHGSPPGQGRS